MRILKQICIIFFYSSSFALTIPKPFSIRYNPYTQSIETINSQNQLVAMVRELKSEINVLEDALKKIEDSKMR